MWHVDTDSTPTEVFTPSKHQKLHDTKQSELQSGSDEDRRLGAQRQRIATKVADVSARATEGTLQCGTLPRL